MKKVLGENALRSIVKETVISYMLKEAFDYEGTRDIISRHGGVKSVADYNYLPLDKIKLDKEDEPDYLIDANTYGNLPIAARTILMHDGIELKDGSFLIMPSYKASDYSDHLLKMSRRNHNFRLDSCDPNSDAKESDWGKESIKDNGKTPIGRKKNKELADFVNSDWKGDSSTYVTDWRRQRHDDKNHK